ncbi:hypothetical protein ACWPKO_07185 [Coraliomargarita sp. W4R53]
MIPAADASAATPALEAASENVGSESPANAPIENPGEYLTAVLNGEVTDEELEAVDNALDSMMLGEAAVSQMTKGKPLLSVDEAGAKLSPEILDALAKKFKGSLTQVRHMDELDKMF